MNKLKVLIVFMLLCKLSYAQTPNYIRSWEATAPQPNQGVLLVGTPKQVKQSTQYIDGLGRIVQTVIRKGSMQTGAPNAADIVAPVILDDFGNETLKYLPYVEVDLGPNTSSNSGLYKPLPLPNQQNFAAIQYPGESFFHSQTVLEASPMSRPLKVKPPGNSWVGSDRGQANRYMTNLLSDDVKKWTVSDISNSFGAYSTVASVAYPTGELTKSISTDEHDKQVIEFKDKEGKVLLKKVQLTAGPDLGGGKDHNGWLCTYYLYDIYNNLRAVIQPRGVELLIENSWNINALDGAILDEQCFRYEYDHRNRMVMKKVPGAGEVYMVYDNLDRLVMKQDANMRNSPAKWLVTKYDVLSRPVETGLWTDAGIFSSHADAATNSINYPNTASDYETLTILHYDDYAGLPSGLSDYQNTWNGTVFSATNNTSWPYPQMPLKSAATRGMITWTQTKVLGSTTFFLNAVSYYDDKGRVIQVQNSNITGGVDVVTTQYSWAGQPLIVVQKQVNPNTANPQTHVLVTKMTYDDLGRVLNVKKAINSNVNGISIVKDELEIVKNTYDKLGQLVNKDIGKKKNVSGSYTTTAIETLKYDYNIRGWLLGMNRGYAKDDPNNTANYFGFDLGYDKTNNGLVGGQTYAAAQYNGNISGTVWKSKGDGEKRRYDYAYDAANRLIKADFTQYSFGVFNQTAGVNFNVKMGTFDAGTGVYNNDAYDANGNIKRMQHWGLKVNASIQIDNLAYEYVKYMNSEVSNRLAKVTDGITTSDNGKLGDFKDGANSSEDYLYDVNGNLTLDNNKSINAITYNHLNLPSVISVTGKGAINYMYDAAGNKLKKQTIDNTTVGKVITTTMTYVSGAVYESKTTNPADAMNPDYGDKLQFLAHEEGRIRYKHEDNTLHYDYMLKDHLGNVRMLLTEEQKTNHYPTATLESGTGAPMDNEALYYDFDPQYVEDKPTNCDPGELLDYYNDNGTDNPNTFGDKWGVNEKMYRMNGQTNPTGLGVILKVMAGDRVSLLGKSYYHYSGQTVDDYTFNGNDIVSSFLSIGGGTNLASTHGATTTILNNNINGTIDPLSTFSNENPRSNNNDIKAGVNCIVFDEQFNFVAGYYDAVINEYNGGLKDHFLEDIEIPKNGYIYIYCSNESNIDVFFDNLEVIHNRGAILEETHYYPFGLTMSGISSKTFQSTSPDCGCPSNKKGFNGNEIQNKEFSDGSGLELYDFNARTYDQQIGRFNQIDPFAEMQGQETLTPYHFSLDNPVTYNDPTGKCPWCGVIGGIGGFIYGAAKYGFKNGGWKKVVATTAAAAIGGLTMGLGSGLIASAGLTGANAAMAAGGTAILSGATTSLTDQGISMALGAQDKFDGADLAYSMTLAVPELLFSKAVVDPIGNSVKSELSGAITDGAINTLTAKERGVIVKDVAKNLRKEIGSGITRKHSKTAAEKIVNMMEKTEQNTIRVGIKISNNAVNVSGVVVENVVNDASMEKIQNQ